MHFLFLSPASAGTQARPYPDFSSPWERRWQNRSGEFAIRATRGCKRGREKALMENAGNSNRLCPSLVPLFFAVLFFYSSVRYPFSPRWRHPMKSDVGVAEDARGRKTVSRDITRYFFASFFGRGLFFSRILYLCSNGNFWPTFPLKWWISRRSFLVGMRGTHAGRMNCKKPYYKIRNKGAEVIWFYEI